MAKKTAKKKKAEMPEIENHPDDTTDDEQIPAPLGPVSMGDLKARILAACTAIVDKQIVHALSPLIAKAIQTDTDVDVNELKTALERIRIGDRNLSEYADKLFDIQAALDTAL